jgi:hypothetical protein
MNWDALTAVATWLLVPFTLLAAALGAFISGLFLLTGQRQEFLRQNHGATRALLVELRNNAAVLLAMTNYEAQTDRWPPEGPNPMGLRRLVWDSQLAHVSQILDDSGLESISSAYATAESLAQGTRLRDGSYAKGIAMLNRLAEARAAFDTAIYAATDALRRDGVKPGLAERLRRRFRSSP